MTNICADSNFDDPILPMALTPMGVDGASFPIGVLYMRLMSYPTNRSCFTT